MLQISLSGNEAVLVLDNAERLLRAAGIDDPLILAKKVSAFTAYRDFRSFSLRRMGDANNPAESSAHARATQNLGDRFVRIFDELLGLHHHTCYIHNIAAGHVAEQIQLYGNRLDGITQTLETRHQTFKGHKCTNGHKPLALRAATGNAENEALTATAAAREFICRILQAARYACVERWMRCLGPSIKPKPYNLRKRKAALMLAGSEEEAQRSTAQRL